MAQNNLRSNGSNGGVSIIGLLGIVFVILKLVGVINWSWWWVTLPFWGGLAVALFILVLFTIAYIIRTW